MAKPDQDKDGAPQKQDDQPADDVSTSVAETVARLHFEGRGLDPKLEGRYDDD